MSERVIRVGKTKIVLSKSSDTVLVKFLDNVDTKGLDFDIKAPQNGKLRLDFCETIYSYLASKAVKTHWKRRVDQTSVECERVEMFPVEVVVRNIAEGSVVKNYLFNAGEYFKRPLVNMYLKYGYLDPLIDQNLFQELSLGSEEDFLSLTNLALQINEHLITFFDSFGIELIDFKAEFGLSSDGALVLADEISPDCIRLRKRHDKERIDKDIFRKNTDTDLIAVLQSMNKMLSDNEND